MRHLISIVALLTVFFWVGSGLTQHVYARSAVVLASNNNSNMSKKEIQAKAQAERRYDTFMRLYNRIWSIYGFLYKEYDGTPGNISYANIVENVRNYEKHEKALLDIIDKLAGPTDLDAQAKAQGFADRNWQLQLAAKSLDSDIKYTHEKLTKIIKEAAEIGIIAEAAKVAMNKACTAKTRAQAKPLAEQCKEAALQAMSRYKYISWDWPETEKRDNYMVLCSELQSREDYAMQYCNAYKNMIDSKNVLLKERLYFEKYFQKKHDRLHELVTKLDKLHSELKHVLRPYKNRVWAKAMADNSQAARVRVGTIYELTQKWDRKKFPNLYSRFRDRRLTVSRPERFDDFIGVRKKLENYLELVSSIQEYRKPCKASAIEARDDAKKALACVKKLPAESPNSNKDQGCPSSWNRCGSHCCPPDVPCWDHPALSRAIRAGKCR